MLNSPIYEILNLKELSPELLEAYGRLQFVFKQSSPKPIDLFDPKNHSIYALGASVDGVPVGLLLMTTSSKIKVADVKSLFIAEPYRRKGIGSQLLQRAFQQLHQEDYGYLFAVYPEAWEETPGIETFLHRNGFSGKTLFEAEFLFEYDKFKPDWLMREYSWPKDLKVFPWREVSYQDVAALKDRFNRGDAPAALHPFREDSSFESLNSLGLRYEGTIVGWMITQRVTPSIIDYSNLFIEYEFQKKGYSIQLLVDAIRIQCQNQVRWGMFRVNISQASASWLKFIRRRLAPQANFIFEYHQSCKKIN